MAQTTRTIDLPQVVAIAKVSRKGAVPIKKLVRNSIGTKHAAWIEDAQVLLVPVDSSDDGALALGRSIPMPAEIRQRLGNPEHIAFVQCGPALAIKRFDLAVTPADNARIVDVERGDVLTRVVSQNAPPSRILAKTESWAKGKRLQHSLRDALAGIGSFEGLLARQALGWSTPRDEALRMTLIDSRLAAQQPNGSWEGQVSLTARLLRELADLAAQAPAAMERGMAWLLNRPESPHNPGMVFGYDDLVTQQMDIVSRRQSGQRARFRERRAQEMHLACAYDTIYFKPCGPRVMWPNAHVLDTALRLGYEDHPRIQRMLSTLAMQDWCECGYQHGTTAWKRTEPMDAQEVEAFVASCRADYANGGLVNLDDLYRMDISWTQGRPLLRISHESTPNSERYTLARPSHLQGCEMVTTRALAHVADEKMLKLAVAHLWRFGGRQDPETGAFGGQSLAGYFHTPLAMLDVASRFDKPIALAMMARALPGVMAAQRPDGLWGDDAWAPSLTLVVARTLARLAQYLPGDFVH